MIPAFEGLFPAEHDSIIRNLLFRLAHWHALAKLRLHTDESLTFLDEATRSLGQQLRKFQDFTCRAFNTLELPSETAARWRRKRGQLNASNTTARGISGARPKSFNLNTYKLHALGDYVRTIRLFGTTDSYTTQIVSQLASPFCKGSITTVYTRERLRTDALKNSTNVLTRRTPQGRSPSKKGDTLGFGASATLTM